SYEQIAAAGGGILSTVRATRAATDAELVDSARRRLDEMLALGVTTIEAKSGYGLDTATELRILRLLREIDRQHPISIVSTFLGAHSIPAEHRGDRQGYLELLMDEMLPAVAAEGLATFCDVFCEKGVFRPDETRAVLTRARELGLGAKIHAEQLHNSGGVDVGIELGAVSVDHLEQIDERQIRALAASQTIAVLLPAATLFLGSHHFAPGRALLDAGVRVALATDSNPGSAMTTHLPLMTTLAAVYMGLRPDEALRAITRDAAAAIGLDERAGRIAVGRPADLVVTNLQHENQLPYRMASNPAAQVFKRGALVAAAGRRVDFSVT
ncbi:MAG: imidazolonepropionase, partial [Myxococcales bacterium]|nr:imidazolonepropionase [Myxococcales bacterium]